MTRIAAMIGSWPSNRIREAAVAKDLAKCCRRRRRWIDRSAIDARLRRCSGCALPPNPRPFLFFPPQLCVQKRIDERCVSGDNWRMRSLNTKWNRTFGRARTIGFCASSKPTCLCPLDFYPCTEWIIDADVSRTMANSSARHICHHLRNLATRSSSSHGIRFPNGRQRSFAWKKYWGENT